MKISFLSLIFFSLSLICNSQQISIFDKDGEARAFIDFDEDAVIFTWDGKPVAFLEKDGKDICVFGFNGKFLGWYEDGIIYDKDGFAVGARKGAVNMIYKIEKIKGITKIVPIKPITPITPIKPYFKSNWSNTSLSEFLYFAR